MIYRPTIGYVAIGLRSDEMLIGHFSFELGALSVAHVDGTTWRQESVYAVPGQAPPPRRAGRPIFIAHVGGEFFGFVDRPSAESWLAAQSEVGAVIETTFAPSTSSMRETPWTPPPKRCGGTHE